MPPIHLQCDPFHAPNLHVQDAAATLHCSSHARKSDSPSSFPTCRASLAVICALLVRAAAGGDATNGDVVQTVSMVCARIVECAFVDVSGIAEAAILGAAGVSRPVIAVDLSETRTADNVDPARPAGAA